VRSRLGLSPQAPLRRQPRLSESRDG